MIKRLAVIPARSGSKRIKNKNLQKIGKKSLLENCIEKCLSSKIFKEIHVSTDSEFFLNKIKKYKLKNNFLRPKILSDDKSPVFDVLKYVIKEYKRKNQFFDEVWLVFATNPFISKKHLLEASKLYNKNKKKFSIMSVSKYNFPIEWAHEIKNKNLEPCFPKELKNNSSKFKPKFCDAGMFVIYQKDFLKKKKLNYKPYELSLWDSVDIDNIDDLELARKLYT
tara:strand:+ start:2981 stop:3649 length:669 start_codon:yes stop_codon:yes gene_type:complete